MVSEKKKMLGESELSALPMNADGKRFFHFFDRGPPIILGTLQKGLALRYSQLTTQHIQCLDLAASTYMSIRYVQKYPQILLIGIH